MADTQKIIPHLWFDTEAVEAAKFYCSAFPNSSMASERTLYDTPGGDATEVAFSLNGYSFMAISAGPLFKINPSISFFVNFDPSVDELALENLDKLWTMLIDGGKALMPLGEYPFSKYYGWVQDKYGVSWQLMLTNPDGESRPYIIPSLLFVGDVCGKAEEALDYYVDTFKNSRKGLTAYYPPGMEPDKEGTLMFGDFMIENQWFAAMDSAQEHKFSFNEGISLLVQCDSQEEIDTYWDKLSAVPEAEQCGWLKDAYGVSWQITPAVLNEMLATGSDAQQRAVTKAFLEMKKFDIAKLEEAYRSN